MKTKMFITTAAVAMSLGLNAQPASAPAPKGQKQAPRQAPARTHENLSAEEQARKSTDRLKTALQLNDEQARKLYDLDLKYAQAAKSNMEAATRKREEMKQRMADRKAAFEAILSASQKAALKALRPVGRGHGPHAQAAPGSRPEQLVRRARHGFSNKGAMGSRVKDFSPEAMAKAQSARMKALLQLSDEQACRLYELNLKNATADKANREATRKAMQEFAEQIKSKRAEIEALLTPEQKAAYDAMRKMERNRIAPNMQGFQRDPQEMTPHGFGRRGPQGIRPQDHGPQLQDRKLE